MTFRRHINRNWARIAMAAGLAIGTVAVADAQGFGGKVPEPYTPAPDAKDLKSVLFKWEWAQGMLKGHDERDMVATLEYQGKGTIQVDGQPCTLTKYRASTNYQSFSQRIQYTCTRSNGQEYSNIEVVSGLYAWNEDIPGAQIGPTKGTATAMPKDVAERLIRIWASPQGAPKAAVAGTTDTFWLGANPGTLFADGTMKVEHTSLAWENGKPVVTFPIPAVPGAMATATIDPVKYTTDSVVVKHGGATTEFMYSDYQDWNNPLNKIGVLYAGKMMEHHNGTMVRDLTTTVTETGNVYVVAPVPASVKSAMQVTGSIPKGVMAKMEPPVDTSAPTPQLDGHPNLTGNWAWNDWIGNYMSGGGRRRSPWQAKDSNRDTNQTEDFELYSPSRFGNLGRPIYKPEYWDKVQQLDMWTNKYDPVMTCQPLGIPREGPPRRIYQTDKDITFIYYGGDAGGGYGEYRIIPTDGRPHPKNSEFDITYMGDTVGHWEGDTLVLDSVAFTDTTWFGRGGFFHSDQMHTIEKFRRQGDALYYDITVEDPSVLAEPYVYPTRVVRLNKNPNAGLVRERGNCEVYETKDVTSQIRH
ncbi:MAG TPA: hypothetical protein VFW44_04920 [Bryobacteraceae bacterium]|nr:hypothetical protein [Bryobacteraceae bacterium]